MAGQLIAKVAVAAARYWIDRPFDYKVPPELEAEVAAGARVIVPFARGNRRSEGIVLALSERSGIEKLKNIDSVLDKSPVLSDDQIKLALWMRDRYFCTVYDAARTMLPAGLWYNFSPIYGLSEGYDRESAFRAAERSEKETAVLEYLFACGGSCDERDLEAALNGSPASALAGLLKKGVIFKGSREERRVQDKTVRVAVLGIPAEEALEFAAKKRRSAPSQAAVLELLSASGKASVPEICGFTGASQSTIKTLAERELIIIETEEVFRRPKYQVRDALPLPELAPSQEEAFGGILSGAKTGRAGAALLFGVTGSGKTPVYIRLIEEMRLRGKSSILMVPEISLTPQLLSTFSSYFGENIAVLHSSLSIGERYDEWKRIKSGLAKVVIGTRSAVFAPVQDLGIIIIDEEQEDSYKSESNPRYHARDIAKYRCLKSNALLLLGSATPDIVSRYAAETGRYQYYSIPERFNRSGLPKVEIVDMKRELRRGNSSDLSSVLVRELSENIANGEQSILFLNRRGSSTLITCGECGYIYQCPNCSVSLIYHSAGKRLMCHYCGHSARVDEECPECGGTLNYIGAGTQKIEEQLLETFPEIPVLRMDADTVSSAGSHEALLGRFQERQIPIMVGTQMVTKGLNFENVTLVGVLSADQSLYAGDYRAGERTFSLITQVVGRAGRYKRPGRAVIQTFTPDNQIIRQAAVQDYDSFYRAEIEIRRLQNSPPFANLCAITASGTDEQAILRCLTDIKEILNRELKVLENKSILGPAPLPVVKVMGRFRYRVTLVCAADREIRALVSRIVKFCNTRREYRGITVFADLDA